MPFRHCKYNKFLRENSSFSRVFFTSGKAETTPWAPFQDTTRHQSSKQGVCSRLFPFAQWWPRAHGAAPSLRPCTCGLPFSSLFRHYYDITTDGKCLFKHFRTSLRWAVVVILPLFEQYAPGFPARCATSSVYRAFTGSAHQRSLVKWPEFVNHCPLHCLFAFWTLSLRQTRAGIKSYTPTLRTMRRRRTRRPPCGFSRADLPPSNRPRWRRLLWRWRLHQRHTRLWILMLCS